ncbi:DUF1189 domain-containing protein [Vagococcus carniphilus]|uniref:DUF1189 domain-containing protein n=1 Tax=Vagococcus carniphilus TaxID=218144 RepID=UPI00288FCC4B|nr:DUF1189 domain-containing protein [Vagococcus carniphilus]MDT2816040.1 DUF1189 domain-containing protein [Vagococcus carniphilus]MDT2831410.1 DUF1189 domain-containing protein [Vagococcus carniphilus]MDT2840132.1 DUF1189 domain-containing protein [Vagococcus carniphilus]MDT2855045.1 DUF1189 domain-containing protein [Vagococcus carniphilus]
MSTFNLIKAAFTQPTLLIEGRKKKGFHVFLYMILLSIILSLPVVFQSMDILSSIKEDGDKIVQKLPEFSIEDGKILTDKKDSGFIYQTNSMIFTFDPEGKRSKNEVEADSVGGVMTIALLKNEAVIVMPTTGSTADMLDSNSFSLPYTATQMRIINKEFLNKMLTGDSQGMLLFVFVLLISAFMIFVSFLVDLIMMTFFANIFVRTRMIRLKFSEVFKILVYCATIPSLLTMALQFIWPSFPIGSIALALTLLIYFNIFPKPTRPNRKNKK